MESETHENPDGPFDVTERRESDIQGVLRNFRETESSNHTPSKKQQTPMR